MGRADASLWALSAAEAAARFRDRSLSPVEYLDALIARAESVEPRISAFTYRHFDEARDAARRAEARFARGGRPRPLEGLPVAVKDSTEIAGMPNSAGSLTMKDHVATRTSFVNERILAAGAIVHARTATPEFSCATYTHSRLWGVTRNPWNPDYTPGGSSGGAGAALAAGLAPLATGSDIGGSIRIPASCCGVVGYKPPHGRNPMDPPLNLDPYCHAGPMARSVCDIILLQNVMAGPHPGDITSLRPKKRVSDENKGIKGWRIAYSPDLGFYEIDPAVRENTERALDVFRDLGAVVEEVRLPWTAAVEDAAAAHLTHIFGASLGPVLQAAPEAMTDYARAFAERGLGSRAKDFLRAMEVEASIYPDLADVFARAELFVCPTNALPAVPAEFDHARDALTINGRPVTPFLGWVMTPVFNMLNRCPVLSVPTGRAPNGVPTGLQIVGPSYTDQRVFTAALAYETASDAWAEMRRLDPLA
jgi:amidase